LLPSFALVLAHAELLLRKHKRWFEIKWTAIQAKMANKPDMDSWPLKLPLKALNAEANITIEQSEAFACLNCDLIGPYSAKFSLGKRLSEATVASYIIEWLKHVAYRFIEPRLRLIADKMGLAYQGFQIALHKSQWGSCSPDKYITLNAGLLFFSAEVVDYVCIHELAHLRHMNHSKTFWNLVAQYCPNHGMMKAELRRGAYHLPTWLYDPKQLSLPKPQLLKQDNQGRDSIE
jgi:predicted metal-dependent hydrolase